MCTRYVLMEEHYRMVLARLGISAPPVRFASRFNIAPGTPIPVVRSSTAGDQRETAALQWGLIASWAKSKQDKIVNARAESVATKPSFRDALRSRRCVIPASGFFEWETVGRLKKPWLFQRRNGEPFGFAGLWDRWQQPEGDPVETCAFITTEPNELMRPIHNRMPVMLNLEQCETWLTPSVVDAEQLAGLLRPPPTAEVIATRVSSRMNSPRVDDPACVEPISAEQENDDEPQLSLGL